jgi:hypothetical protein
MEEKMLAYSSLVRKPEVKRQRGGPDCRWEDNIKWDIRK